MRREEIASKLVNGFRLIAQDKARGNVYCVLVKGRMTLRIRFTQYLYCFEKGLIRLVKRRSEGGFDHCEYVGT